MARDSPVTLSSRAEVCLQIAGSDHWQEGVLKPRRSLSGKVEILPFEYVAEIP